MERECFLLSKRGLRQDLFLLRLQCMYLFQIYDQCRFFFPTPSMYHGSQDDTGKQDCSTAGEAKVCCLCRASKSADYLLDADSRSFQSMQHHGCKCICWEKELGICCISHMGLMRSISRVF